MESYSYGSNRRVSRIRVCWKPDKVKCTVTKQASTSYIQSSDREFILAVVYGHNKMEDRRPLWNHLAELKDLIKNDR